MKTLPKEKNSDNCVLWLRDQLPELPYGLWTLEDKEKIINSSKPVIGSGAISADGVWFIHNGAKVFSGHVALVTDIKDDIITIKEANYQSCAVTEREGTKDKLKIVGFFVPERLKDVGKYHTANKLEKVLQKIWSKFDGDKESDQKEMADKLEKEIDDYELVIKNLTESQKQLILDQSKINEAHDLELVNLKNTLSKECNDEIETLTKKYKKEIEELKKQPTEAKSWIDKIIDYIKGL